MGSSQNTQKTETTAPLAAQMPYLSTGFQSASDALAKANSAQGPSGFTAQMTPEQIATFRQMVGYNSTAPGTGASAGANLTGAGVGGISEAFNRLNNFKSTGSVESTIADATRYADNPAISGMVDAAMRDATRTATEQTLPGITLGSRATGNVNSSRSAIAEGMVSRGLAEKRADISANLRGAAYDNGLNLANNQNQFSTNTNRGLIDSLMSGGAGAAGLGLGALSNSIDDQNKVFGTNVAGGAGLYAGDQAKLTNEQQKYGFDVNSPFAGLNNFWNIVGSKNWGGTTNGNSTTENDPGIAGLLGAGLFGASSLFNPASGVLGKSGFNLFGK